MGIFVAKATIARLHIHQCRQGVVPKETLFPCKELLVEVDHQGRVYILTVFEGQTICFDELIQLLDLAVVVVPHTGRHRKGLEDTLVSYVCDLGVHKLSQNASWLVF